MARKNNGDAEKVAKSGTTRSYTTSSIQKSVTSHIKIDLAERDGDSKRIRFGSVTVDAEAPTKGNIKRNIKAGQNALKRAMKKIMQPGVTLGVAKGVPLYYADPKRPDRIIRKLKGKRESGVFENGVFKPCQ